MSSARDDAVAVNARAVELAQAGSPEEALPLLRQAAELLQVARADHEYEYIAILKNLAYVANILGDAAGRLHIWVGDKPMSRAKPVPWSSVKTGKVDLFAPFPIGVDPQGRPVTVTLMFALMIIGALAVDQLRLFDARSACALTGSASDDIR